MQRPVDNSRTRLLRSFYSWRDRTCETLRKLSNRAYKRLDDWGVVRIYCSWTNFVLKLVSGLFVGVAFVSYLLAVIQLTRVPIFYMRPRTL